LVVSTPEKVHAGSENLRIFYKKIKRSISRGLMQSTAPTGSVDVRMPGGRRRAGEKLRALSGEVDAGSP
jgi:hypothetical protein